MKKVVLATVALTVWVIFSYAQRPLKYVKGDNYEGVIFSRPMLFLKGLSDSSYIPTEKDIARMEKMISGAEGLAFLRRHGQYNGMYTCNLAGELSQYKRHYFGEIFKGVKIITTYFFKQTPGNRDWKKGFFMIADGGCGYFKMVCNVKTNAIVGFYIGEFP